MFGSGSVGSIGIPFREPTNAMRVVAQEFHPKTPFTGMTPKEIDEAVECIVDAAKDVNGFASLLPVEILNWELRTTSGKKACQPS